MQGALPTGFSNGTWSTGANLFPYLTWQFPTSTPQVVSGFSANGGGFAVKGQNVTVMVNGVNQTALSMASGDDDYFYDLLPTNTITGSNSKILLFMKGTGGVAFFDQMPASLTGLTLYDDDLYATTNATSYNALRNELVAAAGTSTSAAFAEGDVADLDIRASAPTFTFDSSILRPGDDMTVNAAGNIAVDSAIYGGIVSLNSGGTITSDTAGVITANELGVSATGAVTLNAANKIASLGGASASSFSLTDAASLSITGNVTVTGCCVTLNTTGAGHNIAIDAPLSDAGHTVTLNSAGTITQNSSGVLSAKTLRGSSVGAVTLSDPTNAIGNLGPFASGNGNFTLDDADALSIVGALNVGTGTLDLVDASTIGQDSSGIITATTLEGSSLGATTLTAANRISDLGAFTAGGLSLTDAASLTIDGTVNGGSHSITLKTTGTGHNLTLDGALDDAGHTVTLTSARSITGNSAGIVTASTLTGSSSGTTTLTDANAITHLGAFSTANHSFALSDARALTVDGAVDAGTGDLALTTTGAGNNLAINAHVTGHTINLTSGGKVTESSAGAVLAHLLNVSANTGITLTSTSNDITSVGTDHTNSGSNTIDQN